MRAGTVALRLIRGAFHQIDIKLTRWLEPLPQVSQRDSADALRFRKFFGQLPFDEAARGYMEVHLPRLMRTMTLAPQPAGVGRALELGAYLHIAAALHVRGGYPEARAADVGPLR